MTEEETSSKSPLNDVMIAMDVVDTLRHDEKLVERELNDEVRRSDLIDRLRKIYADQGIEVPDSVLEEGVRALEQDRFVYKPPPAGSLKSRLARAYISRHIWGRFVGGALAILIALYAVNYFAVERPKANRIAAEKQELTTRLPEAFQSLAAAVDQEAQSDIIKQRARRLALSGRNAASAGNLAEARKVEQQLKTVLDRLRQSYRIRIVNRPGEVSGLWRIPPSNPNAYNFYLVVEAVGPDGKIIPRLITNEETGKTEEVRTWAQRVSRAVLEDVKRDKEDDGIIQNAIVGNKTRGEFEPDWTIPTEGGAITRWRQP